MEAAISRTSSTNSGPESAHFESKDVIVSRTIRAVHTTTTVRVYQAYSDAIADAVLEGQSFRTALERGLWSASRMTWIKPSKVWMAYRCGWTVLKEQGQARVLALDLDRRRFEQLMLARGMLSGSKGSGSETCAKGGKKCRNSSVVIQWDPERMICVSENGKQVYTASIPHTRSIQVGLRPPANGSHFLLDPEIVVGITDVTSDFRGAVQALQSDKGVDEAIALLWPDGQAETVMQVPTHIQRSLEMSPRNVAGLGDAVVVLGCTANPPHRGHFHCLKAAKVKAEQLGYNVLWTTIAVAPFGYVQSKMKRVAATTSESTSDMIMMSDEARLRVLHSMASAAMALDPSLMFLKPERTYGSALECGRSLRPSSDVKVIVVVGGDRFNWTKRCHSDLITFGCARDESQLAELSTGLEEGIRNGLVPDPEKWVLIQSVLGPQTSSTLVRGILANSELSEADKMNLLRSEGYSTHAAKALIF